MRTVTTLTLALLALSAVRAYGQEPAPAQDSCNVEGSWEMIDIKVIYPNRVDQPQHRQRQVKILTPSHFAFGRQADNGEDVFAGGGRYTVDGDTYTEIIEYHSSAPLVGTSIAFDCRREGDLWYHSGQIGDFRLEEVWRRIGSDATLQGALDVQDSPEDLSETDRLTRMEREKSGLSEALRRLRGQENN